MKFIVTDMKHKKTDAQTRKSTQTEQDTRKETKHMQTRENTRKQNQKYADTREETMT